METVFFYWLHALPSSSPFELPNASGNIMLSWTCLPAMHAFQHSDRKPLQKCDVIDPGRTIGQSVFIGFDKGTQKHFFQNSFYYSLNRRDLHVFARLPFDQESADCEFEALPLVEYVTWKANSYRRFSRCNCFAGCNTCEHKLLLRGVLWGERPLFWFHFSFVVLPWVIVRL